MKFRLIIVLLLFLTVQGYSERTNVILQSKAFAAADDIFLGDIASIFGKDKKLVARLNSIFIKCFPQNEKSVEVSRFEVKRMLGTYGLDLTDIEISGTIKTTVEFKQEVKRVYPLSQAVKDFVQNYYAKRNTDFEIQFSHLPEISNDISANAEFKVIPMISQKYHNKVVVVVGIFESDKLIKKYPVSVKIRIFKNILIARKKIHRLDKLLPEDFALMRRDVTNMNQELITDFAELTGKRAFNPVFQGEVLTAAKVESIPVVERGDVVKITTKDNSFIISTLGRARKSGGIGEIIPVVNLNSRRQIQAKIVDKSTVIVEF